MDNAHSVNITVDGYHCTLAEFRAENRGTPGLRSWVDSIMALAVGESITLDCGAGGVCYIVRTGDGYLRTFQDRDQAAQCLAGLSFAAELIEGPNDGDWSVMDREQALDCGFIDDDSEAQS